jgi:putative zinc finger/helix-turn-helix YgiT family protein
MKPFPWKCRTCRKTAVVPTTLEYKTEVEHDGRVYPVEIPDLKVLRCEACSAVVLDDEANQRITEAFRAKAGLLTPEQIRRGREALGLTQKELAARLQVAEATISRWETGGQVQQRAMDQLLRTYFNVPAARHYMDGLAAGLRTPG